MQGLNVYQIRGQSEREHHSKNGHDVDEEASGFEFPAFQLSTCAPIALQTGKHQNDASNDRRQPEPNRHTRGALPICSAFKNS